GWYLGLGLAVVGAWALLFPSARARLGAVLRAYRASLAAGALLLTLLLLPLASHYLEAARMSPRHDYAQIAGRLPWLRSWLYRGTNGWAQMLPGQAEPRANTWPDGERALGIGRVTTVLVLLGFVRGLRRTLVRLLVQATATFILSTTVFFYDGV